MDKYHFLISSKAGKISSHDLIEKIKRNIDENIDYDITVTEYENHIKDFCAEKKKDKNSLIVVCGGDGTVSEAANVLAHGDVPLGVIPTGTGNDFSRSIYGNKKIDEIISSIHKLKPTLIDLLDVDIKGEDGYRGYCVNVLSFGFDTLILKSALEFKDKYPWSKGNSYFVAVLRNLNKIISIPMEIDYVNDDGEINSIKDNIILGAICNGGYYGNGFNPNPVWNLEDGNIEQCFLRDVDLLQIVPLILNYRKGKHIGHEKVIFEKGVSGKISSKGIEFLSNVDGQVFSSSEISWRVDSNALYLLK